MILHEKLLEFLKSQGISSPATVVAGKFGLSRTTVSQWLNGTHPCALPYVCRIVDEFSDLKPKGKKALLANLILLLQRDEINRSFLREQASDTSTKRKKMKNEKWTPSSRILANETLSELDSIASQYFPLENISKRTGLTLRDFPESFYPLVVVSGDKRESSEARINESDFGAQSASPGEKRWLLKLGLNKDVLLLGDKKFVHDSLESLTSKFRDKHLLVIGSPSSNHLTRRLMLSPPRNGWRLGSPLFRFNIPQEILTQIEIRLGMLRGRPSRFLVQELDNPQATRAFRIFRNFLSHGGIVDPTNTDGFFLRGVRLPPTRDFGTATLAMNPFSRPENPYYCIIAAGYHVFGTAHAIKFLSNPENFEDHPFGGIIRVDMTHSDVPAIGEQFDNSSAKWDTDSGYTRDELRKGFKTLKGKIQNGNSDEVQVHLSEKDIDGCLQLLDTLAES